MKEIEILFRINCTKEEVLLALNKFKPEGIFVVEDVYYYNSLTSQFKPKENSAPTEWFRLRKKDSSAYLTHKSDFFKDGVWQYSDESEVLVSNYSETKNILEHIGFKELVKIKNTRHTFTAGSFEILLEDVENLGLFIEVEYLDKTASANVSEIRLQIKSFIDNLHLDVTEEIDNGKPGLMLKHMNLID